MDELPITEFLITTKQQEQNQLLECNTYTSGYGLSLSQKECSELVGARWTALKSTGRIELGGGILPDLIKEFCDSPYLMKDNYAAILEELQNIFYYFKNECLDKLTDEELIQNMKLYFDNEAQGDLDYLRETRLERLCYNIRCTDNF